MPRHFTYQCPEGVNGCGGVERRKSREEDATDLSEVNVAGEEDNEIGERQQTRVTQRDVCQLLVDVVKCRPECIDD